MYKKNCIVCGKSFESNSKYADTCSVKCRRIKIEMPCKVRYVPSQEEKQDKNKINSFSELNKTDKLTDETLRKMSWIEKYNSVDIMTKVSMLSKALFDINIIYSYGELRVVYDNNKNKYKELEAKVLKNKI